MTDKRKLSLFFTAACATTAVISCVALNSGCRALGYHLGNTLPPGVKNVYVPTFVNKTREPQLEAAATQATIEEIQREGNLRVVNEAQADSTLEVTLIDLILEPLRYKRDQSKTTQEYRLKIKASIVFTQNATGKKLVEGKTVQGEATFDLVGDLTTSKRNALPEAARDLAHDIVESIVEHW